MDKIFPDGSVAIVTGSKSGAAQGAWSTGAGETKNSTKPVVLNLDGTNSWVNLGDFENKCISDPSLCTNGISVSFKVNIQDSGTRYLLSSGGQSSRGFAVYYVSSVLHFEVRDGEKAWQVQRSYEDVGGTWRTMSFSWNQATGLTAVIVGSSNSVVLRDKIGKVSKAALDLHTSLVIGRPNNEEAKYGKGAVRDVAVWEMSLSDVKLKALHNCNGTYHPPPPPPPPPPTTHHQHH